MKLHFLLFMAFLSLACGVSTLPVTGANVSMSLVANTAQPTNTELVTNYGVTATPEYYALSRLNIRECPSTDCAVIGYFEEQNSIDVYGVWEWDANSGTPKPPCPRWYHVRWGADGGWSCAGWVSK